MANPVQIPGYQIEQQLGSGGMAKVFLAVQESVQRRVAMKIMSQVLLVDDAFSERFIREARIAANLTHPHIVAVHDVGVHDVHHYIAMEYLPGGDLAHECERGVELVDAVRIAKEIASALEYAHRKGFVHRDVKPENILFRDNGAAVLTDFGIARAVNSATQMTKTGAVIGTPQYMSPEQARGKELDGRSDVYSLGIVFYEMLTGTVPYQGSDSVAVGIKHVTDPVPKLPAKFSRIQPVLERFLAKNPDQRYATGGEAFVDLQRLGEQLDQASSPPATSQHTELSMPRIDMAPASGPTSGPRIGSIEDIAIDEDLRRRRRDQGRGSSAGAVGLLVLIALVAGLWYWQDRLPFADWVEQYMEGGAPAEAVDPKESANDRPLQSVADTAPDELATVDLDGSAETSRSGSIPSRSEAANSAAVEEPAASEQVAEPEVISPNATELAAEVESALTRGDVELAKQKLSELQLAPGSQALASDLQEKLTALEAEQAAAAEQQRLVAQQQSQIEQLLSAATSAREAGRWAAPDSDNAVDAYRAVLALDADNPHATRGLRAVAQHYVDRAELALEEDRLEEVTALIQQIQSVAPDTQALTQIRRRLTLYREQRDKRAPAQIDQAQLQQHLGAAQSAIAAGNLMNPPGESAWDELKAALRVDPNNAAARTELSRLADLLAEDATSLMESDLSGAIGRLGQIRQVDPSYRQLAELESVAASRAATAAAQALESDDLNAAERWLNQAERLRPGLPELDQLHLRLNIARETSG